MFGWFLACFVFLAGLAWVVILFIAAWAEIGQPDSFTKFTTYLTFASPGIALMLSSLVIESLPRSG